MKLLKTTKMKALVANKDFSRVIGIDGIGETVLIKSSAATGWAIKAKVVRETKTQVEVECERWIPTEDTFKWGVKNGLKDRFEGWISDWSWRNKVIKGNKRKFWRDTFQEVGDSQNWNPSILCKLI